MPIAREPFGAPRLESRSMVKKPARGDEYVFGIRRRAVLDRTPLRVRNPPMTASATIPAPNVGFLAILQDPSGTLGGYLVTNSWGRPLEFRVTSAVQPNKVQAILYGASLPAYLCGELIAKTLVEKSTAPIRWVV